MPFPGVLCDPPCRDAVHVDQPRLLVAVPVNPWLQALEFKGYSAAWTSNIL
jgi:hypothetical protein